MPWPGTKRTRLASHRVVTYDRNDKTCFACTDRSRAGGAVCYIAGATLFYALTLSTFTLLYTALYPVYLLVVPYA